MLMEELFRRGIMVMGPSRDGPSCQAGVFNMKLVSQFPATGRSPAYTGRAGRERPHIAFDPFGKQWRISQSTPDRRYATRENIRLLVQQGDSQLASDHRQPRQRHREIRLVVILIRQLAREIVRIRLHVEMPVPREVE
jgi:hypothetical protein